MTNMAAVDHKTLKLRWGAKYGHDSKSRGGLKPAGLFFKYIRFEL
jgi:hypothetical protein